MKEKAGIENWRCIKTFKGSELAGTICAHPFRGQGYEFDVPALPADFVTEEAGTGFVHIAPGHGQDDFILGMKHGVEVTDNVADDGTFRPHVPLFAGLEVYTQKGEMGPGNFAPLKALAEAGMLLAKGSIRHEYPHSWRSKAPVIFRTTPQWFIAMDDEHGLRDKALQAIKDTKWVPAKGEARIQAMVEGRPDWCISRQRSWGVPIALFVHKESGEVLRDEAVLDRIGKIFEDEGSDAWWARPAEDFLGNNYDADDYDQIFDIVDVWFDSGSTHVFVLDEHPELQKPDLKPGQPPIDLYLEGSDQHRGWFQSSLLESCGTRGHAPYETVLTHGFVLDEKGYKMSKSLGNTTDPMDICNQYGADILRLWVMLSDYAEDIRIGKDSIKSAADIYRRLRNTFRFLLGALNGMSRAEMVEPQDMPELERYMLHQIATLDQEIRSLSDNFEFGRLTQKLHHWCNSELSAFYFDIRKDSLYCDAPDDMKRRACRTILVHLFDALSAWLAPVLCFTAEEAWSHRPDGLYDDAASIHLRQFPAIPAAWKNDDLAAQWAVIKDVRKDVLAAIEPLRASKALGSSLEAAPRISVSAADKALLAGVDLAEICITAPVTLSEGERAVAIEKASGHKCVRCWKTLPDVTEEGGICGRCAAAVKEYKDAA